MNEEIIIIDRAYKYQVDEILDGGVGFVRLMSLMAFSRKPPESGILYQPDEHKRYPYRNQLAAKTIRNVDCMGNFAEECTTWLELNERGIVPVLKITKYGEQCLSLMPRYTGNLRNLLQAGTRSPNELLKSLMQAVTSLAKVYDQCEMLHQDLKPENFLYLDGRKNFVFEISDWGTARIQASLLSGDQENEQQILSSFGTIPYMAPERFAKYMSDVQADIFGLGMICFEILTGELPYEKGKNIPDQIISGEYFGVANEKLSVFTEKKTVSAILKMIQPVKEKRAEDYSEILQVTQAF